jgi:glycosyltransferase involved in cell wall biosynthesis
MRFAFVSTMADWPWGGSEELWSQTAVQLKRAGHDVQASVAYRPRLSDKITLLAKQGIRLEIYPSYRIGMARRIWNKLTLRYRRSYGRLKRFKPDLVIISQGHNSGGLNWAKICREASIPYVLIVHCNSEHWWFEDREVEEAAASYRSAQKVFCVSRSNLNLLRMQLGDPMQNGEIVWNPYKVSPESIPAWPVENGRWRLACVARLDPAAKGQELLLQVLARPEWRARPIELNVFGEGPHELALRRLAGMLQLNDVHFRGQVSDIKAIWEQNHLLVLPSRYEGLPLVLVEAMWCGRPAVVTDVAGNTEVCVDNETGFVAPAPTVALLADTLQRAWDRREDWQRMGQAARARAESQIPRDPIAVFADRLRSCADTARQALTSTKPS